MCRWVYAKSQLFSPRSIVLQKQISNAAEEFSASPQRERRRRPRGQFSKRNFVVSVELYNENEILFFCLLLLLCRRRRGRRRREHREHRPSKNLISAPKFVETISPSDRQSCQKCVSPILKWSDKYKDEKEVNHDEEEDNKHFQRESKTVLKTLKLARTFKLNKGLSCLPWCT